MWKTGNSCAEAAHERLGRASERARRWRASARRELVSTKPATHARRPRLSAVSGCSPVRAPTCARTTLIPSVRMSPVRSDSAFGRCRGVLPAGHLLSLRRQKKKAKKGDPAVAPCAALWAHTEVAGSSAGRKELATHRCGPRGSDSFSSLSAAEPAISARQTGKAQGSLRIAETTAQTACAPWMLAQRATHPGPRQSCRAAQGETVKEVRVSEACKAEFVDFPARPSSAELLPLGQPAKWGDQKQDIGLPGPHPGVARRAGARPAVTTTHQRSALARPAGTTRRRGVARRAGARPAVTTTQERSALVRPAATTQRRDAGARSEATTEGRRADAGPAGIFNDRNETARPARPTDARRDGARGVRARKPNARAGRA